MPFSFEANPDFAKQEEEILAFWQKEKIFEQSVTQNKGKTTYVIYDGPPYANSKPPLHTIVPMSFKDLVGRYQTMKGYFVPRQAGWDTHGLPIEVQVEKQLGLSSKKEILGLVPGDETASIRKFNQICRASVFEFKKDWDRYVPRVGYWLDLEHPYITYEPSYVEKTWGVFKEIWDKNLVYKGYKVVPHCPRCETTLSAAEVAQEYQDIKDTSVFVTFPLKLNPQRAFLAWTTTPWTLPGNVALAVGKDIQYVVVRQESQEYILAKSCLKVLRGDYTIIKEMSGKDLVGLEYQGLYPEVLEDVPEKKFYVLAGDFVTTEDGTGIVHTAVMYGEDDFNLGKEAGLPMRHSVGLDGRFLENVPEFFGLKVREALGPILKSLNEKGRLYAKEIIEHSYPFCWRCKTPLIYYAKDSWFIAVSKIREALIKNNQEIDWIPAHIKMGRFGDFIQEARDWAISRERFWGIPLPVWVSLSGKMLAVGSFDELRSLAKKPNLIGSDFDPHRPDVDDIILVKDREEYRREPAVLDIWFESGAMPYASGREEAGLFPADYIAEATDQTRGWFYTLLVIGTIIRQTSPYKRVVCMGLMLDEQGKKMSKSVGNVINPDEAIALCGVDAIRWFIYTVNSPGETKMFSFKEIQNSFRQSLLLCWNVFNYFVTYSSVNNFVAPSEADIQVLVSQKASLAVLDRWILSRQAAVIQQVTNHLDSYDFMRAGRTLTEYINDLSTWYLRRSRKRSDSQFFAILYSVLLNLSKMMAPLAPFMSEKIFQVLRTNDLPQSVHLSVWPKNTEAPDKELELQMRKIRQAVELGLSVRAAQQLKVRQPLGKSYLRSEISFSPELMSILAEELNVLEIELVSSIDEGIPQKEIEGMAVGLNTHLTDQLIIAGQARELLRHIQQLRKERGLRPGQAVTLRIDPAQKAFAQTLLEAHPDILKNSYVKVVEYDSQASVEITIDNQPILIDLVS